MGALPPARSQPHIAGRRAAPPLCLRAVTRRPRSRSRSHRRRAGSRGGGLCFSIRGMLTNAERDGAAGGGQAALCGYSSAGAPRALRGRAKPPAAPRGAPRSAQSRPELLPKLCPPHPAGTRLSAPGTAAATRVTTASRDRSIPRAGLTADGGADPGPGRALPTAVPSGRAPPVPNAAPPPPLIPSRRRPQLRCPSRPAPGVTERRRAPFGRCHPAAARRGPAPPGGPSAPPPPAGHVGPGLLGTSAAAPAGTRRARFRPPPRGRRRERFLPPECRHRAARRGGTGPRLPAGRGVKTPLRDRNSTVSWG